MEISGSRVNVSAVHVPRQSLGTSYKQSPSRPENPIFTSYRWKIIVILQFF